MHTNKTKNHNEWKDIVLIIFVFIVIKYTIKMTEEIFMLVYFVKFSFLVTCNNSVKTSCLLIGE